MRPNFLYIGTAKAGSTWLHQILQEHPQVFVPAAKEIQFFDRTYARGTQWYETLFADAEGQNAIGELTPKYLSPFQLAGVTARDVAQRIFDYEPRMRLIVCLREPRELLVSWFNQLETLGMTRHQSVEEYASDPTTLHENNHAAHLEPYYELFPREQILVLFYDELQDDAAAFCRQVFSFLGVDPDFLPPSLEKKIWTARQPRSAVFNFLAYQVGQLLRRAGLAGFVGRVSLHPMVRRSIYRSRSTTEQVSPETWRRLHAEFSRDYPKLAAIIGREVPTSWHQVGR